jgi:hypothetical protein
MLERYIRTLAAVDNKVSNPWPRYNELHSGARVRAVGEENQNSEQSVDSSTSHSFFAAHANLPALSRPAGGCDRRNLLSGEKSSLPPL